MAAVQAVQLHCLTPGLRASQALTSWDAPPFGDTRVRAVLCLRRHLVGLKEALGVREWGLTQATLEEAFLQICQDHGIDGDE